MRKWSRLRRLTSLSAVIGLVLAMWMAGCDTGENPLAPYEGSRPLIIRSLTASFAPDIQWVGGRVAAVGINRGERAALDSTLVWLRTADGNALESPVYVRETLDEEAVTKFGGTPSDSLEDGQTYTLWLAEKASFDAALTGEVVDEFSFADTTFSPNYFLSGRSSGGVGAEFAVFRDQRLTSDAYTVTWTPAVPFRRMAITNATLGGFTDLIWHIVLPDEMPDSILPPVVIGEAPEDAIVATPWDGFGTGNHVLWAATEDWAGERFGFRTEGYAQFQIFGSNFD